MILRMTNVGLLIAIPGAHSARAFSFFGRFGIVPDEHLQLRLAIQLSVPFANPRPRFACPKLDTDPRKLQKLDF